MTKITKMSKDDLIKNIEKAENLLNNKRWVKQQTKFWLGVFVVHLGKLQAETELPPADTAAKARVMSIRRTSFVPSTIDG